MLRRNGPVIKPWSQSSGRKGVYNAILDSQGFIQASLVWRENSRHWRICWGIWGLYAERDTFWSYGLGRETPRRGKLFAVFS